MIKILDRYIGLLFFRCFLLSLTILIILYMSIDFFTRIWRYDPSLTAITKYYILLLPEISYQMMPISTLMGTLIALGVLSRSNELIAIQANGISLFRTSMPLLFIALLIAIGTFAIGDRLMPLSSQHALYSYQTDIKGNHPAYSQRTVDVWYRAPGVIYNVKSVLPDQSRIEGITIYYLDESFFPQKIVTAFSGDYREGSWILKNVKILNFPDDKRFPIFEKADRLESEIRETPQELIRAEKQTDIMSTKALKNFIKKNQYAGFNTNKHEVILEERYSFSFACVILVFLAIPFGIQRQKHGGFATEVAFCLFVTFIYWFVLSALVSLGYKGSLPPFVAAWGANIIFLILGLYLLRRFSNA
ncbi:MAG: LPS export ABC transporter permease LptG [Deltaproteobacteria bacterium RIFCSPHIGHO2_12_FULL_43_9]|nr:MAG: LPS export ABC transporter permease LptG [Deltaproteobacteria bacterium RIFCSPHIGHO2_12_FULL_43_9]